MHELRITTRGTFEFVDVTDLVQAEIRRAGIQDGVCLVYCPHTTAGITVNEAADPSVAADLQDALDRIVSHDGQWRHLEGNSPAHVKATIVGASAQLLVRGGQLALGRWQGVFFCEFDGPRERTMWVQVLA
ncbi:secondary thiamine-phosphate synthase enzyme YjbQ [Candidatus Bipolaricaulota bacterium]|nr:secondary thiamine-phosphate synthase enzyme YjbQ [Candidatus Bipolaricaulota bacterium]